MVEVVAGAALVASLFLGGLFWRLAARLRRLAGETARWRGEAEKAKQSEHIIEETLHHCADVLRSIASALPVGLVAIDRNARVELWNHAAETILGYRADEMIGQPAPTKVFMSVAEDPDSGAADMFLRMVTGQSVKSEEVRCRRKDGSALEASFSGAPLIDADERIRGAICVFEDLTHRNAMARALYQAQKMEAVGQLTGGMAHDFNNILGIAVGNLDLVEEQVADRPAVVALVKSALDALLRGAELTRALLAFARRQPLRPTIVDVADLLAATMRVLSRALGEQVQVVLQIAPGLWPVVADAAQLESAVTNLSINARDAMPGGGRLSIAAHNVALDDHASSQLQDVEPGEYVAIEVSDTGSGMSSEVLVRAFEPFFTTKPPGQGTGLGLSMVYGFAKQSGGHIKLYSEVGVGTTVRLYLPRAMPADGQGRLAETVAAKPRGGRETILVVDDNPDVRRMAEQQLTSLGYRVVQAEHGPDALAMLERTPQVDLLFTDVMMPHGMDGFALAAQARRRWPQLKVLFTSGFPGASVSAGRGLDDSMAFIGKPYRRQELAQAIRQILDSKG